MSEAPAADVAVDAAALREEVKSKYREVAVDPDGEFHFHTGRYLARRVLRSCQQQRSHLGWSESCNKVFDSRWPASGINR